MAVGELPLKMASLLWHDVDGDGPLPAARDLRGPSAHGVRVSDDDAAGGPVRSSFLAWGPFLGDPVRRSLLAWGPFLGDPVRRSLLAWGPFLGALTKR